MKMKKMIAVFLALVMALCIFNVTVFANDIEKSELRGEPNTVSAILDDNTSISDTEVYNLVKDTGGVRPSLPTANVEDITADHLTFAKKFTAVEPSAEVAEYYGNWYADFVLTLNVQATFNANGGADGYLSGQYDGYDLEGYDSANWLDVPWSEVTLKAGESFRIMDYAAKEFNNDSLKITYNDVLTAVKIFHCGIFFSAEYLLANPNLTVNLELRIYNPENENEFYTIGSDYNYTAPKVVAFVEGRNGYNQSYTTLQDAINAANGKTVVLVDDIELDETVVIAADKTLTLNLNGYTVSGVSSTAKGSAVISNSGNLTIIDGSDDESGKITSSALSPDTAEIPSYANNTIINNGKLVIESGTIENTTAQGSACYAIDTAWYSNSHSTTPTITVNGGRVVAVKPAIRLIGYSTEIADTLVVNGGVIEGSRAVWIHLPGSANEEKRISVEINEGTLTSTDEDYNLAVYSYSFGDAYSGVEVKINGGTFNGNVALGGGSSRGGTGAETMVITDGVFKAGVFTYNSNTEDKISISGGIFATDVKEYCVDGFTTEQNPDGTYSIVEKPEVVLNTKIFAAKGFKPNYAAWDDVSPYAILFAAGIDSRYYEAGGFEITINGVTKKFYFDETVWTLLTVDNVDYTPEMFGEGNKYIMYFVVTFTDEMVDANLEFTVRAFLETYDGDTIYSAKATSTLK